MRPTPPRPDRAEGPDGPRAHPPSAAWSPLETVPVFLVAVIATAVVLAPIDAVVRSCSGRFILLTLVSELAFVGAVLGWIRLVHPRSFSGLGLPREPWRDLGAGVATGLALVVLGGLALTITQAIGRAILGHRPPEADQVVSCVRGASLVALAPVVILAAPLGEETLFRGFLYKGLRRRFSVWPAAIASAVVFGLVHFQGAGFAVLVPGLAVVGLGLALVYERRQSLLASMAAHATFNLVGYLFILHGR